MRPHGRVIHLTEIDRHKSCIRSSYTSNVAERDVSLDHCTGFEWDDANVQKNWDRHQVTPEEAEDVFFNDPVVVRDDVRHSQREKRYYALRQTRRGRHLFVAFTIRRDSIRVISVRDMNHREQDFYDRHEETNS